MLTFRGAIFLSLFIVVTMAEDSDITKFMKHLEVIPDVISEGPRDFLMVKYDSGVMADKGVELTPTQVKNQPKVDWEADPKAFYTLIMIDPDAPTRSEPKSREWQHWLVGNIPGKDISKGDVLAEYVGSGPPKDTGLHRYVLLVYKQPKKIQFAEKRLTNKSGEGRAQFSTKKFAKNYSLGVPYAGNFFQAQYDDYVPVLYAQLGA